MDGQFQSGEWDQTTVELFTFFMSDGAGNPTVLLPADLYLLNDQKNLYLGLRILGVQYNNAFIAAGTGFDAILLLFDNNNNSTYELGEDQKILATLQGNVDHAQRGWYLDLHIVPENEDGADPHFDGLGRMVHSNVTGTGDYTAELVLPLNSGDPNDMAVTLNDPVRFNLIFITKCCEGNIQFGGLFGLDFQDSSGWGSIRLQPGQSPPDPAPRLSGTIAFITSELGQGRQIYVMNADGTDVLQRTRGDQVVGDPSLSADGQKIIYTAAEPDPDRPDVQEMSREIFTMNARQGRAQRLTSNRVPDYQPVFSLDGQEIAFVREGNIWVMSANGRNARPLTSLGVDSDPVWTPDGRIVFMTGRWDSTIHLAIMNADGTNITQLTRGARSSFSPRVSPDGQWITFYRYDGSGPFFNYAVSAFHPWNIYRIRMDGTDEQRLTDDGLLNFLPAFSPDGRGILYQKILDFYSFYTVLYYLDLQTGESRRVLDLLSRVETFDWR
jgi:Tol biopolymer transport system component